MNTHVLVVVWCLVGVSSSSVAGNKQQECSWLAGVSRVAITPKEPLWMGGYAARTRPADGTALQPLWAKALALQDREGNPGLWISCDILGFPRELSQRICDRLESLYGVNREQIVLSASHTHSAPVINTSLRCIYPFDDDEAQKLKDYATWLEEQVVVIAGEALTHMTPAAVFAGNGVARFAVNRRQNSEKDLLPTMAPKGPSDHSVPTLKVVRADGTLCAVLFGYACHATVLDGYQWSGDYPGFAQETLEQQFPGTTVMFFAGCGADQNPLPRRSVALARQYGLTLAAAVARVLEEPMIPLPSILKCRYEEIDLPLEAPPNLEQMEQQIVTTSGYEQRCLGELIQRLKMEGALPVSCPFPIQAWRLGTQYIIILSGEPTVSYAITAKELFGQSIFVVGYANDQPGYIPSDTILLEGGYEGRTAQWIYGHASPWKSGIENQIFSALKTMLHELEFGKVADE